MTLAEQFDATCQEMDARLDAVPAARADLPYRDGGWTRKQVLGHLIDSALNNHVRFAGAATNPSFAMLFGYEEKGWVRVHGYAEMAWAELLAHWRSQNWLLARVVRHVPLQQKLRVGDTEWTLEEWVVDYQRHLRHHVAQITA